MKSIFIFIATVFLLFGNTETFAQKGNLKKAIKYQNSAWNRMQQYGQDDAEVQTLYTQAIEEYKRCIASNNKKIDEVFHNLGRIYSIAPKSLRNHDEAIKCFSEALKIYADKKQTASRVYFQAECYNDMGNVYSQKGDFSSAYSNYEKATDLSPQYYSKLAMMYWLGLGVEQDFPKAMSLYREASAAGTNEWDKIYAIDLQNSECPADTCYNPAVDLYMGYLYLAFINEPKSMWLPVLTQAADMGYPPAQTDLWDVYKNDKETDKGLPYLQKAADSNYSPGITAMGASYMEFEISHYKIKDFSEAEKWLKKAAMEGNPTAQFNLGLLYYYKNGIFLPSVEYLNMAEYWFNEADKQGYKGADYFRDQASKGSAAKQQLQQDIRNSIINIINAANSKNQTYTSPNTSTRSYSSDTTMPPNQNSTSNEPCNCSFANFKNLDRAYNGYAQQLLNMQTTKNPRLYTDKDRINYQSSMKSIREKNEVTCGCAGLHIHKNDLEDWDGRYD